MEVFKYIKVDNGIKVAKINDIKFLLNEVEILTNEIDNINVSLIEKISRKVNDIEFLLNEVEILTNEIDNNINVSLIEEIRRKVNEIKIEFNKKKEAINIYGVPDKYKINGVNNFENNLKRKRLDLDESDESDDD